MVLRLRPEALLDLEAAARWYEVQEQGLGRHLVEEVRVTFLTGGVAALLKVKAARVAKGVERMLLSVPPLDEVKALPWPAQWACGGRGLGR